MVPHEALFAKLHRFGIQGRALKFIKTLYEKSTIQVRIGGGSQARYSEPITLEKGFELITSKIHSTINNLYFDKCSYQFPLFVIFNTSTLTRIYLLRTPFFLQVEM